MTTKYFETKEQFIAFRTAWAKAAQAKKITASHMVMYNIIRGKEIDHGFTPITNHTKLLNGTPINLGLVQAVYWLNLYSTNTYWQHRHGEEFLAPFEGAITIDDLQRLDIEEIKTIDADFGIGKRLKAKILAGARPTTFNELLELDMEDAA